MSLSISEFKAKLISGARPNLFKVEIGELGANLAFLCKATELPGSNIGEIEVPYQGRSLKVAGNRTFDNWEITVINDVNFDIHNRLIAWMDSINAHEGNTGGGDLASYMRDGAVIQLGRDGQEIKRYDFKDIWPSVVAPLPLDWASNDELEEFQCTFTIGSFWASEQTS